MGIQTIQAGTRKVREIGTGHVIGVPKILMDSFDLKTGDLFNVSADLNGNIALERAIE